MKKLLIAALGLSFAISANAATFTMKVKSVGWDAESMAINIKGTNGNYIAYLDGTSQQSLNALEKAAKKKSCVKITTLESTVIKAVAVKCPAKLPKVPQY
jgi:hypothetical protein